MLARDGARRGLLRSPRAVRWGLAGLAVALSLATPVAPEETDGRADVVLLTPEKLDRVLVLTREWSFHPGDDPAWAAPAFDDSSWPLVSPSLGGREWNGDGWPGIGWFRRRVALPPGAASTTVGVHVRQAGASELYVDGVLAVRFGSVSAVPEAERAVAPQVVDAITLEPGRVHLLAVRYSNASLNTLTGGFRGFELRLGDLQAMAAWGMRWARVYTGMMAGALGMFAALAVLHLLLYLFQPALRENLYFTVFTSAQVAVLGTEMWMNSLSEIASVLVAFNLEMTCVFAMVLSGMLLERRVFDRRVDLAFWVVVATGAVTLTWLWSRSAFSDGPLLVVFLVLGLADMLRLAIGALLRREPDAWVVAVGFTVLTLSFFGALLRNLSLLEISPWPFFIAGMGTLVLSFSVYLTRRVARTGRELARRMSEVQELTARALEQERAAREQEIARRVLEADNLRKTVELEEARTLQLAMLPRELPDLLGFEVAVHMATATEVGGDYYDFVPDPDGRWTVALGDATGHGLQAGMVVGVAKSLLRTANGIGDLGVLLRRIHVGLSTLEERRASMAMVLVRLDGRSLDVASAGMPPLLIRRADSGAVDELLLPGVPLGTMADAEWASREVPVGHGDAILLMSDGIVELTSPDGEPFGYDRVREAFGDTGDLDPRSAVDHLLRAAAAYRAGEAIVDDVTLVVLRARAVTA